MNVSMLRPVVIVPNRTVPYSELLHKPEEQELFALPNSIFKITGVEDKLDSDLILAMKEISGTINYTLYFHAIGVACELDSVGAALKPKWRCGGSLYRAEGQVLTCVRCGKTHPAAFAYRPHLDVPNEYGVDAEAWMSALYESVSKQDVLVAALSAHYIFELVTALNAHFSHILRVQARAWNR